MGMGCPTLVFFSLESLFIKWYPLLCYVRSAKKDSYKVRDGEEGSLNSMNFPLKSFVTSSTSCEIPCGPGLQFISFELN